MDICRTAFPEVDAARGSKFVTADDQVSVCEYPSNLRRVLTPLRLWHLCSLDAPSVATCWTAAIAHVSGVLLHWTTLAAMFSAVWIIYATDRLLDSRGDTLCTHQLEERHRFHRRHRRPFVVAIGMCSLLLVGLVFPFEHTELQLFSALGILLFAYCLLIHARPFPLEESALVPKEFAVGAFFAAAVFIPTVARAPQLRMALFPLALLLAAVCTLNCTLIYAWEHEQSTAHAHWTTRLVMRHNNVAVCLVLSLATIVCLRHPMVASAPVAAISLAVSALCFLLLHASRKHIDRMDRRALIDFALLFPLGLLLLQGLSRR